MNISHAEHAAELERLAAKAAETVAGKYEGREATPHLLTLIEMEVHEYVTGQTTLPFVLTVGLTRTGLVILTIVPPGEAVELLDDVILTGIEAAGTKH